jgi:hypothetical protein
MSTFDDNESSNKGRALWRIFGKKRDKVFGV